MSLTNNRATRAFSNALHRGKAAATSLSLAGAVLLDGAAVHGTIGYTILDFGNTVAEHTFIPDGFMSRTPSTYKRIGEDINEHVEDALWAVSLGTINLNGNSFVLKNEFIFYHYLLTSVP